MRNILATSARWAQRLRRVNRATWGVVVSLGFLTGVAATVDARALLEHLHGVQVMWLWPFAGLAAIQVASFGARWAAMAAQAGVPLTWSDATREYALSILLNQLLPTGVVGDGLRLLRHARREVADSKRAVEAGILDRLSGYVGYLVLIAATLPLAVSSGLVSAARVWLATLTLAAVAAVALASCVGLARLNKHWARQVVTVMARGARALLHPRGLRVHLPASIAIVLTLVLQLGLAARALGIDLNWLLLAWIGPIILLSTALPSAFGGLGLREAASALLFGSVGLDVNDGVAASLVFGAFSLASACLLAVAALFVSQPEARGLDSGKTTTSQG